MSDKLLLVSDKTIYSSVEAARSSAFLCHCCFLDNRRRTLCLTCCTLLNVNQVAIAVSAAKALATKVGIEITSRIFEVMGTRSTATKYGFNRYWRDLRIFTLHDPVDYKLRDIGNWLLNDELPVVTQYS